ncbi:hypothetical protein P9112_002131 [Eukaryota sp. TZLM1-RC]
MQTFLHLTLEKLIKTSRNSELKHSCQVVLEEISSSEGTLSSDFNADKYFTPLRLACESDNATSQKTALDCIQKMIAYGHLTGTTVVNEEGTTLLEVVVSTICKCQHSQDPAVILQVIKALLTLCSSHSLKGQVLVQAIWTLLGIFASSIDKTSSNTARGALIQIVGLVFSHSFNSDSPQSIASSDESNRQSDPDHVIIFSKFLDMLNRASKRKDNESLTVADHRLLVLVLEFIINILDTHFSSVLSSTQFEEVLRNGLYSVFLNCVYEDSCLIHSDSSISYNFFKVLNLYFELFLPRCRNQCSGLFTTCLIPLLNSKKVSNDIKTNLIALVLLPLSSHPAFPPLCYINFDCDLSCTNIWEVLTQTLADVVASDCVYLASEASGVVCNLITSLKRWYDKDQNITWGVRNNEEVNECQENDSSKYFEAQKEYKTCVEKAIALFNEKPKQAFEYLVKENLLIPKSEDQNTEDHLNSDLLHRHFAHWIMSTPQLDRHKVGEFLGGGSELSRSVVAYYFKLLNFSELSFVSAMRSWLVCFELPKEAQQIDRIVEAFAQSFASSQSDSSFDPDSIYALAFATLMLNTDLYNPKVEHKMSIEGFVTNFRGVAPEDTVVSDEFLQQVYKDIAENEIERHHTVMESHSLVTSSGQNSELVLPSLGEMFGSVLNVCIDSFWNSLKVSFLNVTTGNKFFVTVIESITLFISLVTTQSNGSIISNILLFLLNQSNLIARNQLTVRGLASLEIIFKSLKLCGNFLTFEWILLLATISEVHRLINLSSTMPTPPKRADQRSVKMVSNDYANSKLLKQRFSALDVDNCYSLSESLDDRVLVCYVESLCVVAELELKGTLAVLVRTSLEELSKCKSVFDFTSDVEPFEVVAARFFSLQKIVEVTYCNTERVRHVFAHLWKILSQFLLKVTSTGQNNTSSGQNPALLGINSLRQLSLKFLEREESCHFKFQKDFLKPFELIIHTADESIAEVTLSVLGEIANKRSSILKSGWRPLLKCFSIGAKRGTKLIVQLVIDQITSFITCHHVARYALSAFSDLVSVLGSLILAHNAVSDDVAKTVNLLSTLAEYLGSGSLPDQQEDHISERTVLWSLIGDCLCGPLSNVSLSSESRRILLTGLKEIIFDRIAVLNVSSREAILKSPFIMLVASLTALHSELSRDNSDLADLIMGDIEVLLSQLHSSVVSNFDHFKPCFSTLLAVFRSPLLDGTLTVAKIAFNHFKSVMISLFEEFDSDDWDVVLTIISTFLGGTLPATLVEREVPSDSKTFWSLPVIERCREMSILHVYLLELVLFFSNTSQLYQSKLDSLTLIFNSVQKSKAFAFTFNHNVSRRHSLSTTAPFKGSAGFPSLLKQELMCNKLLFSLMIQLLSFDFADKIFTKSDLITVVETVLLRKNLDFDLDSITDPLVLEEFHKQIIVDAETMVPVQGEFITSINNQNDVILREIFPEIYSFMCQLINGKQSRKIRLPLVDFFSQVVPKFLTVEVCKKET